MIKQITAIVLSSIVISGCYHLHAEEESKSFHSETEFSVAVLNNAVGGISEYLQSLNIYTETQPVVEPHEHNWEGTVWSRVRVEPYETAEEVVTGYGFKDILYCNFCGIVFQDSSSSVSIRNHLLLKHDVTASDVPAAIGFCDYAVHETECVRKTQEVPVGYWCTICGAEKKCDIIDLNSEKADPYTETSAENNVFSPGKARACFYKIKQLPVDGDAESVVKYCYEAISQLFKDIDSNRTDSTTVKLYLHAAGAFQHPYTAEELGCDDLTSPEAVAALYWRAGAHCLVDYFPNDGQMNVVTKARYNQPSLSWWADQYYYIRPAEYVSYKVGDTLVAIGIPETVTLEIKVLPQFRYSNNAYRVFTFDNPQKLSFISETLTEIRDRYAGCDDYTKLLNYAREICDRASGCTNMDLDENGQYPYYAYLSTSVFDNNKATRSVCTAYAAAFQKLCDISDFDGPVFCETVTGSLKNGIGHVWNIIHIGSEKYLVDCALLDMDPDLPVYWTTYFMAGLELYDGRIAY